MSETVTDRVHDHWGTMVGVVGLAAAILLAGSVLVGPVLLAVTFDVPLVAAMHRVVVPATAAYLLLAVALLR